MEDLVEVEQILVELVYMHPCLQKTFGLMFLPRKDIQCISMPVIYGMI